MKVSILMVAYNAEEYILDCIRSVMAQTYSDFEAIIINDGSTDNTAEILSKISDKRFRIHHRNHDYISSLNYGLAQTNGTYIARMDADDVMLPNRLKEQVYLMETHPNVDVCYSWANTIEAHPRIIGCGEGQIRVPIAELMISNPFIHPSSMIKKDFLLKYNLEYKRYNHAEDYKLWLDIAVKGGVFWVIPKVLLRYRISDNQISCRYFSEQKITASKIKNEALLSILNDSQISEIYVLQNIYLKLELLNQRLLLSSETIFKIVYVIYKEIKQNII